MFVKPDLDLLILIVLSGCVKRFWLQKFIRTCILIFGGIKLLNEGWFIEMFYTPPIELWTKLTSLIVFYVCPFLYFRTPSDTICLYTVDSCEYRMRGPGKVPGGSSIQTPNPVRPLGEESAAWRPKTMKNDGVGLKRKWRPWGLR